MRCIFLNRINANEFYFVNININLINNGTCIYTRHQPGLFLKVLLVHVSIRSGSARTGRILERVVYGL